MENDKDLIKEIFKDNEKLLKIIRNVMFDLEVSKEDKEILKNTFKNKEAKEAFRIKLHSKRGDDVKFGSIADFWVPLGDEALVGKSEDTIRQIVLPRAKLEKMFEVAINLLDNPDGEKVDLSYDPESIDADPLQINLLARNKFLNAIEATLNFINIQANNIEMPADMKKFMKQKNSTK